jgi:hypothetical protein
MAMIFRGDPPIELLYYAPGLQDTGDLEGGTKTVVAVAEGEGLPAADYSSALTLVKPTDARLVVKRIATRLAVTIGVINAPATALYCRVYVDAQDADHRLFDLSWNSTGAELAVAETHADGLAPIFALLSDGAAHTFYFYFWVDNVAGVTVTLVDLWEGVGACNTQGNIDYIDGTTILETTFAALVGQFAKIVRVGTGTSQIATKLNPLGLARFCSIQASASPGYLIGNVTVLMSNVRLEMSGTVATDLNCLTAIYFNIK